MNSTAVFAFLMLVTCASACGLWCVRDGFRGLRLVDGTRTGAGGGEPDLALRLLADHGRDQAPDRGDEAGRVEEDNVLGGGGWLELGLGSGLGFGFGLGFGLELGVRVRVRVRDGLRHAG